MAMSGYKPAVIARRLNMTEDILEENYGRELELAGAEARVLASATLFNAAIGGDLPSIAQILKTRGGWSETTYKSADKPLPPIEPVPTYEDMRRGDVWLPCNTKAGCIKNDPELHKEALKRLWAETIDKAWVAGCAVRDFLR
jgi:hypothetical protein